MHDHDGPPGWLQRFHDASHGKWDTIIANQVKAEQQLLLILQNQGKIIKMSETNQAAIDAANASMQATLDSIQTDVTAIAAELAANVPTPGAVPSQASIDTLNANVTRLQAVKAALDGLVVPAPAAPAP